MPASFFGNLLFAVVAAPGWRYKIIRFWFALNDLMLSLLFGVTVMAIEMLLLGHTTRQYLISARWASERARAHHLLGNTFVPAVIHSMDISIPILASTIHPLATIYSLTQAVLRISEHVWLSNLMCACACVFIYRCIYICMPQSLPQSLHKNVWCTEIGFALFLFLFLQSSNVSTSHWK